MNTFVINNRLYKAKAFGFNCVCALEDYNVSLADVQNKSMSLMRGYLAYCGNMSPESAGEEIEAHIANKGKLDDIMTVLQKEIEESDFFRNLTQNEEEETPKTSKTK